MTRRIGILVFDDVEVLDFAGPYEVFTTATRVHARQETSKPPAFEVFTIGSGASGSLVRARAGLRVEVERSLADVGKVDLLVVPGGVVTAEMQRPGLAAWLAERAEQAEITASICTGAFLLAQAGLLDGLRATTHWEDIADLRAAFPSVTVLDGPRWVDEGRIVSSAGISAGIDMSLHLVERTMGRELAEATARQMQYAWVGQP